MPSHSSPTPSSCSPSSPRRSRSISASTPPPSSASRRAASAPSSAPRAARFTGLVPGTTVPLEGDEPAAQVFRTGQAAPGTAPIRVGARLWGALIAEGGDPVRLLELALAAQPAVAFADASAQLAALATRDPLTNLPDHRAFHEQLRSESRRAQRHERALSLVLVNVDGFKQINAEHGRLAGDRVLAEVGRRLAATVRNGEFVSRLSPTTSAGSSPRPKV
jgi:GAF domain-containing protein